MQIMFNKQCDMSSLGLWFGLKININYLGAGTSHRTLHTMFNVLIMPQFPPIQPQLIPFKVANPKYQIWIIHLVMVALTFRTLIPCRIPVWRLQFYHRNFRGKHKYTLWPEKVAPLITGYSSPTHSIKLNKSHKLRWDIGLRWRKVESTQ